MVNEAQLRKFEQKLLDLGDERSILEKSGNTFSSVLDATESTPETKQNILKNLITKAVINEQEGRSDDESEEQLLTDSTLDEFETAFQETDEDVEEPTDDIEEVEDNIDLIEESVGDDAAVISISDDFELPQAYQTLGDDATVLSYEEVFSHDAQLKSKSLDDTSSSQVTDLLHDDAVLDLDDETFKAGSQYKSLRSFSEVDEKLFFENLDTYNIIIKKAVFTVLTDEKISHFAEKLVDLVCDNASSHFVHRECEKLLKILISSPFDTTIYTHETLFQKLYTSSDTLIKSASIVFRRILPLVVGVSFVAFLGFFFIAQPLYAFVHYKVGFHALQNREYETSERHFIKASDTRSMERFYFSYAREYERQRRYSDAKKKYLQLVFGLNDNLRIFMQKMILEQGLFTNIFVNDTFMPIEDVIQYSRNGFLNLAAFTRDVEGNFEEARSYYNIWITKNTNDSDFYIELGNTYIEWYDTVQDVSLLEKSQAMYDKATILRDNDDISLIMRMRYAVRASDDVYIDSLYQSLLSTSISSKRKFLFLPYVELVTYKLMQQKPAYVSEILTMLKSHEPEYINLNYLYAQYYAHIGYDDFYQQSLLQAQSKYENYSLLRGKTLRYAIDTHILLARELLTKYDNVILAKETLLQAQKQYEDMRSFLGSENNNFLARVYELQAEIAIRENNIAMAQEYIRKAQENNYTSLVLLYQQGVVEYLSHNYYNASQYFLRVVDEQKSFEDVVDMDIGAPSSVSMMISPLYYIADIDMTKKIFAKNTSNILLSTANALYLSKNYAAAALYFEKALTNSEESAMLVATTASYSITDNDEEKISNARYIAFLKNNFGVSLYQLSERQHSNSELLYTRAMSELMSANKIIQNTHRVNDDTNRRIIPNLPQINIASITHNTTTLQIYPSILLTVYGNTQRYYNQMLLSGSEWFTGIE